MILYKLLWIGHEETKLIGKYKDVMQNIVIAQSNLFNLAKFLYRKNLYR